MENDKNKELRARHRAIAVSRRIVQENESGVARLDFSCAISGLGVGGQVRDGLSERHRMKIRRDWDNGDYMEITAFEALDAGDVTVLLRIIHEYSQKEQKGDFSNGTLVTSFSSLSISTSASARKASNSQIRATKDSLKRLAAAVLHGKRTVNGEDFEWYGSKAFLGSVGIQGSKKIKVQLSDPITKCAEGATGWLFTGVSLVERDQLKIDLSKNLHIFLSAWSFRSGARKLRERKIYLDTLARRLFPSIPDGTSVKDRVRIETFRRCMVNKSIDEMKSKLTWVMNVSGKSKFKKLSFTLPQ